MADRQDRARAAKPDPRPPTAGPAIGFIHIERTAGSSIHAAFEPHLRNGRWFVTDSRWGLPSIAAKVAALPDRFYYVGGHFGLRDVLTKGLLQTSDILMSIVRDPVERMLSLYSLMQRDPDWMPEMSAAVGGGDLAMFYEQARTLSTWTGNVQCARIGGEPSFAAARAAIEEHYALIGCTSAMPLFVESLTDLVSPLIPGFFYFGGAENAAARVQGVEKDVIARIEDETCEDAKLHHWIRHDLHGLWRRP